MYHEQPSQMKKIIFLLIFMPIFSMAQNNNANNKLPLIERITSDTINGKYKEVYFTYDHLNRVINIIDYIHLVNDSTVLPFKYSLPMATKFQRFEYDENNMEPKQRLRITYEYEKFDPKEMFTYNTELQYFFFSNKELIKDSILEKNIAGWDFRFDNDLPDARVGKFEYGNSFITSIYKKKEPNYHNFFNKQSFVYQTNAIKDSHEEFYIRDIKINSLKLVSGTYFSFRHFDKAINPFKQLNISSVFKTENISFEFNSTDLIDADNPFSFTPAYFYWPIYNNNNPTNYIIRKKSSDSPFIDDISLNYTYNQDNYPVYCTIAVKKTLNNGTNAGSYKKHFTFHYKK